MTTGLTKQSVITEPDVADQPSCRAIVQLLDRIGDKWAIMAIGALAKGPMRFNMMKRAITGVSHRMLTLTLRGLERDGLVVRRVFATIPPKVEYKLTPLGHSLIVPLQTMTVWVQLHQAEIETARSVFDKQQANKTPDTCTS